MRSRRVLAALLLAVVTALPLPGFAADPGPSPSLDAVISPGASAVASMAPATSACPGDVTLSPAPGSPAPGASPTPAASPSPAVSPVPSPPSSPDPCVVASLEPLATPGIEPTASAEPAATATPRPTAKPAAVKPGGVRARLDVAMTRRLRCYEFPRTGCINRADIYHPKNKGDWPTVIAIHGRPRTPRDMRELSRALARRGAVVYNVDYRGVRPVSKGFPDSVNDVACAVRFARATTARYGGDPDHIVLVGHSMGGYVGMMVSVAGNRLAGRGEGCLVDEGSSLPDGFVHLAGVSITKPEEPLDQIFFGGSFARIPAVWRRGNVYNQIRIGGNDDLRVGIIFEVNDPILGYGHATILHRALRDAGYAARLVLLQEGNTHFDVLDMDTALGRRVLRFTEGMIERTAPDRDR